MSKSPEVGRSTVGQEQGRAVSWVQCTTAGSNPSDAAFSFSCSAVTISAYCWYHYLKSDNSGGLLLSKASDFTALCFIHHFFQWLILWLGSDFLFFSINLFYLQSLIVKFSVISVVKGKPTERSQLDKKKSIKLLLLGGQAASSIWIILIKMCGNVLHRSPYTLWKFRDFSYSLSPPTVLLMHILSIIWHAQINIADLISLVYTIILDLFQQYMKIDSRADEHLYIVSVVFNTHTSTFC